MSIMVKLAARVRGTFAGNYPEGREDEQVHVNPRGDLIVSQCLPPLTELVRLGDSWQVQTTAGANAGTAIPTTTAPFTIYNGESANGKCYIIDSFGVNHIVADGTQSDCTTIVGCVHKFPATIPSDGGFAKRSLSGRASYGGNALVAAGASVVDNGWYPFGSSAPVATAAAGSIWKNQEYVANSLILIPPGGAFSIAGLQVAGTANMIYYIRWHEVLITYKT